MKKFVMGLVCGAMLYWLVDNYRYDVEIEGDG